MGRLGIVMVPAYLPQARGRSERMFRTHQDRLPRELALAGITTMVDANRYLHEVYQPAFNDGFMQPAREAGEAFVPWIGGPLEDVLSEQFERQVSTDNCISFEGMKLQITQDQHVATMSGQP